MSFSGAVRALSQATTVVLAAALAATALLVAPSASAVVVDNAPSATWKVNGVVYATEIVGDTLVVGGKFTAAVSPTGVQTPRANLAAFSLSTGALLSDWQADADGQVRALDSDGDHLWVGGQFTTLDAQARTNMGKVGVASGEVVSGFAPRLAGTVKSGVVRSIVVRGPSVYAGGIFGRANGSTARARLVKLDATTGATTSAFVPTVDKAVWAMAMPEAGDVLYIGGQFDLVNGTARAGLARLDATTGALVGAGFGGPADPDVLTLDVTPDGSSLFGGIDANQCMAWNGGTGARLWNVSTEGNVQAVRYAPDGTLYCGFHDAFQGDTLTKAVAIDAVTGVVDPDWRPRINSWWGVHAIDVSANALVLGGAFTNVSGVAARGFAIFPIAAAG